MDTSMRAEHESAARPQRVIIRVPRHHAKTVMAQPMDNDDILQPGKADIACRRHQPENAAIVVR